MSKNIATEQFIKKAKNIHGELYDYSITEYKSAKEKVKILCKEHNEVFEKRASDHLSGQGCQKCVREIIRNKENILSIKFPELSKQWHPIKNGRITPDKVTYGSTKKIWWLCKNNHEWQASIDTRSIKGNGCPYCTHQKIHIDTCLATINPNLSKEWHPTLNNDLTPYDVFPMSDKKVWWICKKNHSWLTSVGQRHGRETGCPYCSGRLAHTGNCLSTNNPILIKSWHPTKNGNLTPENTTANSGEKVWWICEKGHEFQMTVYNRNGSGMGCSICLNPISEKKISKILSENNIRFYRQYKFPDCINKKPLPFDFYLPDINTCIEYDGRQHFEPVDLFGGQKTFDELKKKDKIKTDYCLRNNINLIRISHTEKIETALLTVI